MKEHHYEVQVAWTGNRGEGTTNYRTYSRDYEIAVAGKPVVLGSSEPAFRGDPARHNPEEMLVASLSACHMLWYLHFCAANGVVVTDYQDSAVGTMQAAPDGAGEFTEVTLQPKVTIAADSDADRALALHAEAHRFCFIARSVNFPVKHEPQILKAAPEGPSKA